MRQAERVLSDLPVARSRTSDETELRKHDAGPSRGWSQWLRPSVLAALLVLAGFGLRVYALGSQSIWGDEIYATLYARMDWLEIIRFNIRMQDPQAPLSYYVVKAFTELAGTSELVVRLPSALAGAAGIALIYAVGRKLAGPWVGLAGAAVLALNPYHVWYGQEARTYTLTTALALLSIVLFLRVLQQEAGRWTWIGYVVGTTLLVYSHYFGFLIILAENALFLLLLRARRLRWRGWLVAQAMFVVPYLPFADHGVRMMMGFTSANRAELSWRFLEQSVTYYSLGWFLEPAIAGVLLLGFLLLAALGVAGALVPQSRARGLRPVAESAPVPGPDSELSGQPNGARLSLPLGMPTVGVYGSGRSCMRFNGAEQLALLLGLVVLPAIGAVVFLRLTDRVLIQDRYLILITPLYYLLVGMGIAAVGRAWRPLAGIALLFVAAASLVSVHAYFTDPRYARFDTRGLAEYITENEKPGDVIATIIPVGDYVALYYRGSLPVATIGIRNGPEGIPEELGAVAAGRSRLWLVPYGDGLTDLAAERWLNQHGYRVDAWWFKTARLRLYSLPTGEPEMVRSPAVPWEGGIRLAETRLTRTTVEAGEPVLVQLRWTGLTAGENYHLLVRILDEEGHALAHSDRPVLEAGWWDESSHTTSVNVAVAVPYGTPPGTHRIEAGLQRADGHDLAYLDHEGATLGTVVTLGSVAVSRPSAPRSLEAIAIPHRLDAPVGHGLRLVGYGLPGAQLAAGQALEVILYWQALAAGADNLDVVGQIIDRDGRVVGERRGTTATARYPSSTWPAGEIVRDYIDLPTGRARENGEYRVRVKASAEGDGEWRTLGSVRLTTRSRSFSTPQVAHPLGVRFGAVAELIGFDLTAPGNQERLTRGQPLVATLHWRSLGPIDVNYTVFVQLLDPEGRLVAQHDGMPSNGAALTSTWVESEVVSDRHEIPVPAGIRSGEYQLIAGLYELRTGRRLLLGDRGDHVTLIRLAVGD